MSAIIHREAIVGPDGHIDIAAPELQPGQRVNVTIEPEPAQDPSQDSESKPETDARAYPPEGAIPMIDLMDEGPGQQLFKTADEVDQYLRQERESWDR